MTGLIITIALLGLIFYYYNRIISMREAVISSETEISVQLDRRGKVFDSLLATVKKYLSHEADVFTKITELRAKTQVAITKKQKQQKMSYQKLFQVVRLMSLLKTILNSNQILSWLIYKKRLSQRKINSLLLNVAITVP